ncbi:MAG: MATE family efflux transporter [Clostridia bacterium]|nr:MATE family efflux transporter [Clostridia bacterium]
MPYRKTFLHTSVHKSTTTYRHSHSSAKSINMTEGALLSKIIVFSLPLMVTNLLQVLYNAADMVVVSMSHEPDAVGAIGTTGAFINLVLNIFMGFATGANVMVARHLGAKNDERVSRTTHTAMAMSLIFGVVSAVIGLFISRPILSLMGAQGKLLDLATTYTIIYFAGVPFISAANYLIAIFRAKGDTRTPLYILSASGLVNVVLNLFFVLVVGLSVEGVALATVIANAVSTVFLSIKLSKDEGPCRFSFKKLCLDRQAFRDILYVGLPAGIQGSLFSLSNMIIQSSILQVNNTLYPNSPDFSPIVTGNAATANLEGFIYTAQNSVYQAAITFTSQNIGAKKPKRVKRIMLCCYALGAVIAFTVAMIIFLLRDPLLALYGVHNSVPGSLEAGAYDAAVLRMQIAFLPYALLSFMEVGCGVVRGLGKAISSTVISLFGACAFRMIWIATVFRALQTLSSIYLCLPISWGMTGIIFLIYIGFVLRKIIKKQRLEPEQQTMAVTE